MSQENPQIDDLKTLIQTELACILGEVGSVMGTEIGNLQKQVDLLTGADTAAIAQLHSQITNLVSMLDGDADTPGMQNLQNLLALIDRVAALEDWKGEVDDKISQLNISIATYETRIANLESGAGGGSSCDCEQIATDIQALRDSITLLQGVDATQAQQIITLNGRVDSLLGQLSNLSERVAGLAADVVSAEGKAQQAIDGLGTLTNAVNNLRDREDNRYIEHGNAIGMIRNQIYGQFVGLCDAVKPGFGSAFAAAKAAAIAA